MCESESESHSVVSDSLRPHGLYIPWNFPGQDTEVGSFSLLQGIFPSQGWNPCLPHCRCILYQMSTELFVFPYYSFDVCSVCSNILCLIPYY